jgi:hypothetical protein
VVTPSWWRCLSLQQVEERAHAAALSAHGWHDPLFTPGRLPVCWRHPAAHEVTSPRTATESAASSLPEGPRSADLRKSEALRVYPSVGQTHQDANRGQGHGHIRHYQLNRVEDFAAGDVWPLRRHPDLGVPAIVHPVNGLPLGEQVERLCPVVQILGQQAHLGEVALRELTGNHDMETRCEPYGLLVVTANKCLRALAHHQRVFPAKVCLWSATAVLDLRHRQRRCIPSQAAASGSGAGPNSNQRSFPPRPYRS